MAEKKATRDAYGEALELGKTNLNIVALDADPSQSTRRQPLLGVSERFVQIGTAEQDLIGTAAGWRQREDPF